MRKSVYCLRRVKTGFSTQVSFLMSLMLGKDWLACSERVLAVVAVSNMKNALLCVGILTESGLSSRNVGLIFGCSCANETPI